MNTAARAAVRVGIDNGHTMLGISNGFRGFESGANPASLGARRHGRRVEIGGKGMNGDPLFWNKVIGSVILAGLIVLASGVVAESDRRAGLVPGGGEQDLGGFWLVAALLILLAIFADALASRRGSREPPNAPCMSSCVSFIESCSSSEALSKDRGISSS